MTLTEELSSFCEESREKRGSMRHFVPGISSFMVFWSQSKLRAEWLVRSPLKRVSHLSIVIFDELRLTPSPTGYPMITIPVGVDADGEGLPDTMHRDHPD